jgi:hypothetical protein
VLTNSAAIAATIAISTRLIAFMFSLAMSTVNQQVHRVLLSVSGATAKPHTTREHDVTEMRDLTLCSYVSLIVDRRNITGRHRPGNAWASSPPNPPLGTGSLLESMWRGHTCIAGPIALPPRGNSEAVASHIGDHF